MARLLQRELHPPYRSPSSLFRLRLSDVAKNSHSSHELGAGRGRQPQEGHALLPTEVIGRTCAEEGPHSYSNVNC